MPSREARERVLGEVTLRDAGLRVTRPRLAVLDAVHGHPHSTTDALIDAARTHLPTLSHQAVYDALRVLTDAGVVRRIQPRGSVARYEARVDDNHHHLVCRACGSITDVDCVLGEAPCLVPEHSAAEGFAVDEAEITFWGLCPACAAGTTAAGGPDTPTTSRPEQGSATREVHRD
ncbi:ferric uptake regulator, Fur family [Quadrisphaera granulorum]|uniref:Fur family ferric uptake regulator n=1 Tax=Quadrisphaera granulorum TaxID=317664 RepID=A0A316A555_9ACTN|nr:Fur family transcriptional regulator [Quadrisphaera granulorum]PWJ52669.1 Fur family ferric uptake regulator [Quadrisphaera granulorum]SZE97491.1 ferric uptake regulator, Fur family [Quadrisphaera granulorum]